MSIEHSITAARPLIHIELNRIKQMLVDNGYSNKSIDEIIKNKIETFNHKNNDNNNEHYNIQNNNNNNTNTPTKPITLYYRNIMNSKHKTDETIMKHKKPFNKQFYTKLFNRRFQQRYTQLP